MDNHNTSGHTSSSPFGTTAIHPSREYLPAHPGIPVCEAGRNPCHGHACRTTQVDSAGGWLQVGRIHGQHLAQVKYDSRALRLQPWTGG